MATNQRDHGWQQLNCCFVAVSLVNYLALSDTIGAASGAETETALSVGISLNAGSERNFGARFSPVQQPHEERAKTLTAAIGKMISLYKFIFNGVIYWLLMTGIEGDDK